MTLNNLDALECKSPMWEEASSSKKAFAKTKPQVIRISMGDLNGAIFRRNHYQYDLNNGGGHAYTGQAHDHKIDIKTQQHGQKRTIEAYLENAQGFQKINLSFKNENGQCTLTNGMLEKNGVVESLRNPKRLSEVLLCIYKHVRLSADPKWATRYLMEQEAREVAAQKMDLNTFPKIINNNGQLIFEKPNTEGRCGNICEQKTCPIKVILKTLTPTN